MQDILSREAGPHHHCLLTLPLSYRQSGRAKVHFGPSPLTGMAPKVSIGSANVLPPEKYEKHLGSGQRGNQGRDTLLHLPPVDRAPPGGKRSRRRTAARLPQSFFPEMGPGPLSAANPAGPGKSGADVGGGGFEIAQRPSPTAGIAAAHPAGLPPDSPLNPPERS